MLVAETMARATNPSLVLRAVLQDVGDTCRAAASFIFWTRKHRTGLLTRAVTGAAVPSEWPKHVSECVSENSTSHCCLDEVKTILILRPDHPSERVAATRTTAAVHGKT